MSLYCFRCHCGETLSEHAGMQGPFDHFSSAEMMEEYLVPKGIYRTMILKSIQLELPVHYGNMPMQYTDFFSSVKIENIIGKFLIFFLFLLKT